jgi:outer membrane protein
MKVKIIIAVIIMGLPFRVYSGDKITLSACLDSALRNKADIEAARTDKLIASLQVRNVKAGYIPQVSLAYDYRYYAVIPTQLVPVGMFYPVPTDEMKGIKFGTQWQQIAGLSVYQPLIDLTISSRLRENRINEKLKDNDLARAEESLKYEVINSYLSVWLKELKYRETLMDTLRTSRTLRLLRAEDKEGRVEVTDLNSALINHNRNLSAMSVARSELIKEKIYLSFLTGFPLSIINEGEFDFAPFTDDNIIQLPDSIAYDSLTSLRDLQLKADLSMQQLESEKRTRTPAVGIEGFAGANQYADSPDPFLPGSWYGNSYLGISLRVPILGETSIRNRVRQLRNQADSYKYRLEDEKNRLLKDILGKQEEIRQAAEQLDYAEKNLKLLGESVSIYQERFQKGLATSYDLVNQEIDFKREENDLDQIRSELMGKKIELIRESGMLNDFIRRLR